MPALGKSEALAANAGKGDARAFAALVTLHYDDMFRIAFKWCRNRADAEDIAQNACVRLAKSISGYSGKSAFSSWLYRLVINAAIDWQRQNAKPREADADMQQSPHPDAEDIYYAQQMLAEVDRLPEKEKTALLLVFAEGMSHAEAAQVMEVKESTVSWYIHEARKKLGVRQGERT